MLFQNLDPQRQDLAYKRAAEVIRDTMTSAPLELHEIELEILRRHITSSLKNFTIHFWDIVEPDTDLVWNWHLDELCQVAKDVYDGKVLKVAINVPPGTMKSLLMSVMFRAWVWAISPSKRFLSGSYGSHLSIRDNVKLRSIIESPRYQELFPNTKLVASQNQKERFETTEGGWSVATGVGGIGTGEHPDFTIVDDPLTEQQSRSEVERASANNWIDRTLSTRGMTRDMRTILIMQRFHQEDCTAHVLAKGDWKHVCFPMRFMRAKRNTQGDLVYTPDPRDRRTTEGELLWPELFPERKLRSVELSLGPYGTAGQMQQQPVPEGGGLFKREWFGFVEAAPAIARRVRGWDTGATEEGGDYTAGVRIAEKKGTFFIEHVVRKQLSPAGVEALIKQTAQLDGLEVSQREQREGGSAGKTVTAARAKLLVGFDYAEVIVGKDKVTMSKPFRAQCEAGNVKIVRTGDPLRDAWIAPYIDELCGFPTGKFDDQVDGSSTAFNAVLLEPEPVEEWATW